MVTAPKRVWRPFLMVLLACLPWLAVAQEAEERRQAFIELSASADEVYVQQQLRLTVKLYYTNQIIQGELSDPEHPDAVIEKLGEQKQYREQVNGERYRVVERDYVIFPQKPGRLQLAPLEFLGTARHPRGHHYRIADSATLFPVEVKDIPASFSGSTWLPATDLTLTARGLERTGPVSPGDNLTRTITLTARGLPATTLPSLKATYPEGIRSYPEPEQRQSSAGADGVIGQLQQTVALVPVSGQEREITLPEMRIVWWDVTEDREKVALLPARTLRLTGGPGPAPAPAPAPERQPQGERGTTAESSEPQPVTGTLSPHWIWPLLVALLALGWAATAIAWWRQHRRPRPESSAAIAGTESEKRQFSRLCELARHHDPAFFNAFPAWAQTLTGRRCHTTDDALAALADRNLEESIQLWRESLFRPSGATTPDGERLTRDLKAARESWQKKHSDSSNEHGQVLPPLYPKGLQP